MKNYEDLDDKEIMNLISVLLFEGIGRGLIEDTPHLTNKGRAVAMEILKGHNEL